MTQPPPKKDPARKPVYRYLDHTADLRVEIDGRDLTALFENAGFALFDTIADLSGLSGVRQKNITVDGQDLADLMFNWLRALLLLWTVEGLLVVSVEIVEMKETRLKARVRCGKYVPSSHCLKTDIKAVTYHGLTVEEKEGGWTARVVFDV